MMDNCTHWRGHKFEARYSLEPPPPLDHVKASAASIEIYINSLTKKTYERDICVRCGATVEKPTEAKEETK